MRGEVTCKWEISGDDQVAQAGGVVLGQNYTRRNTAFCEYIPVLILEHQPASLSDI